MYMTNDARQTKQTSNQPAETINNNVNQYVNKNRPE